MNIVEALNEFLAQLGVPEDVRGFVLRVAALLIALVVIVLLRRLVMRVLMIPVRRFTERTTSATDDQIVQAMMLPTRFIIIAIGVALTVNVLDFGADVQMFAERLTRTLIIMAVFVVIYKLVSIIMQSPNNLLRVTGFTLQDRLLPFLRTVIQIFVVIMALFIVIQEWGYDVTGLIASFGVVGLALSLAAQDTASNLFGFTAIVSDNPFQVGDFIVHPDVTGVVETVGIRSTQIRKLDQSLVTVPNSSMASAAITNWSRLHKRWYEHTIGITYAATSADMRVLIERIKRMLDERELVDSESILVRFMSYGDSALEILVRCYVWLTDFGEYTAEQEEIHLAIMDIVAELGLSMAFPSRSIYIETMPGYKPPAMPPVDERLLNEPKFEEGSTFSQGPEGNDPDNSG